MPSGRSSHALGCREVVALCVDHVHEQRHSGTQLNLVAHPQRHAVGIRNEHGRRGRPAGLQAHVVDDNLHRPGGQRREIHKLVAAVHSHRGDGVVDVVLESPRPTHGVQPEHVLGVVEQHRVRRKQLHPIHELQANGVRHRREVRPCHRGFEHGFRQRGGLEHTLDERLCRRRHLHKAGLDAELHEPGQRTRPLSEHRRGAHHTDAVLVLVVVLEQCVDDGGGGGRAATAFRRASGVQQRRHGRVAEGPAHLHRAEVQEPLRRRGAIVQIQQHRHGLVGAHDVGLGAPQLQRRLVERRQRRREVAGARRVAHARDRRRGRVASVGAAVQRSAHAGPASSAIGQRVVGSEAEPRVLRRRAHEAHGDGGHDGLRDVGLGGHVGDLERQLLLAVLLAGDDVRVLARRRPHAGVRHAHQRRRRHDHGVSDLRTAARDAGAQRPRRGAALQDDGCLGAQRHQRGGVAAPWHRRREDDAQGLEHGHTHRRGDAAVGDLHRGEAGAPAHEQLRRAHALVGVASLPRVPVPSSRAGRRALHERLMDVPLNGVREADARAEPAREVRVVRAGSSEQSQAAAHLHLHLGREELQRPDRDNHHAARVAVDGVGEVAHHDSAGTAHARDDQPSRRDVEHV